MKSNLKSLLALILAMCMALSLLSTAVWAAEDTSAPAGDGSVSVQAEESEPGDAAEESTPAEEEVPAEDEPPAEKAEAPTQEEEVPAEEPAAQEEEPAEEPEVQEQEEEASEPAEEEEAEGSAEVEPQAAPDYAPTGLTTTGNSVDTLSVKWTHGSLPGNTGSNRILLEGQDVTIGDNSWHEVWSTLISNARSTTTQSGGGSSWGDLALVTRHEYRFRLCYVSMYGERGTETVSNTTVYYNKDQEKANLQTQINAAKGNLGQIYTSAYDEKGLTANETELLYDRGLYQMRITFTGTSESDDVLNPGTLANFQATPVSRFPNNGFEETDAAYVRGIEFALEGLWYIGKDGTEKYKSLSGGNSFSVNLSDMGYGCNYVKLRLICYNHAAYGVDEYWVETPIYFNVGLSGTPLSTYSALTNKNSISLKPCTAYGTTLTYDDALPTLTGNVKEQGVEVQYRKKGAKSWSKKTFAGTGIPKISGLKADTVYQWKARFYLKSTDHNGAEQTIYAPWTGEFSVCTAQKSKPKVKSIKTSKVKVVERSIAAHTEPTSTGYKWVPKQVWYETTFNVTFTFAKTSKNVKGYTFNGTYAKVKKNKVTLKGCYVNTGKKKQRAKKFKFTIKSCTNTNGPGYEVSGLSPKLKYTGKIK